MLKMCSPIIHISSDNRVVVTYRFDAGCNTKIMLCNCQVGSCEVPTLQYTLYSPVQDNLLTNNEPVLRQEVNTWSAFTTTSSRYLFNELLHCQPDSVRKHTFSFLLRLDEQCSIIHFISHQFFVIDVYMLVYIILYKLNQLLASASQEIITGHKEPEMAIKELLVGKIPSPILSL